MSNQVGGMMDAQTIGWTGVVLAIISLVDSVAQRISRRKEARDKMEFEFKTRELEVKTNTTQQALATVHERLAECQENHEQTKKDLAACKSDREDTSLRLERIEQSLAQKKDKTDGHRPLPESE